MQYPCSKSPLLSPEGIQFPHGVVLHGPSGVGKTLLALAVSSETSAHCLSLSPGDLIRYLTSYTCVD